MMLRLCLLLICLVCRNALLNDFVALEVPLIFNDDHTQRDVFKVNYSALLNWEKLAAEYAIGIGIDVELFVDNVRPKIGLKKFGALQDPGLDQQLHSHKAVSLLSLGHHTFDSGLFNDYFLSMKPLESEGSRSAGSESSHSRIETMLHASLQFEQRIPQFLLDKSSVVVYHSQGVSTGGTTAMNSLYSTLRTLGFRVALCSDANKLSAECRSPSDLQLVVTGEWCHEVLDQYMYPEDSEGQARSTPFLGRGLQYYLGFHHNEDSCTGRVAVADSHWVSKLLGRRQLSAYYLGCPMTAHSLNAFETILDSLDREEGVVRVVKENLIVIDPDYDRNYPPENPLEFDLPAGYVSLYAQDVPPEQMPLLLQRAKLVLDLGMPGPERLSGEGILAGAVPIVSERMNGASRQDFPGIARVNPYNGPELTALLARMAREYEQELSSEGNARFLQYMLSMEHRLLHTSNAMFLSSVVHFVLHAEDLHSEYLMNFQVLALLYLYPLASFDLFVTDVVHYMRHHYTFIDLLKQAGHLRVDPLQPADYPHWRQPSGGNAFVAVKSLTKLRAGLRELRALHDAGAGPQESLTDLGLLPAWSGVMIVVSPGWALNQPASLINLLEGLSPGDSRWVAGSGSGAWLGLIVGGEAVVDQEVVMNLLALVGDDSDLRDTLQCQDRDSCQLLVAPDDIASVQLLVRPPAEWEQDCVVHGVIDTIPWQTMLVYAQELGSRL